ncbi:MAG TPA: UDP-N-acetylmuramoyl-tripeptide--D-alanyl-D-alanine ligase [Bryobacteraceae bacterium]|nr:UDP-N-acetylmuramoyl-tripeptide--D-alanyl-D-alanine ligase [Bryobacteraceae bacterium]
MTFDLQDFADAIGAEGSPPPAKVSGWSVDTRTQNPGDVYFALKGANHDGHTFVQAALEKDAAAVVVSPAGGKTAGATVGERFLLVPDTLRALQQGGAWARHRWGGTVIGVTGSAGKTTTKDAVADLLAVELPTGRTIGNLNNHVGVPLSILRLPDGCRAAVLEMGMNHAGEIRDLAALARPEIGLVTNVGYAHVEFFENGIDGVAAAKRELIEALPPSGVAVLNGDDARVRAFRDVHPGRSLTFGFSQCAEVRAEIRAESPEGTRFRVWGVDFETGMVGRHAVMNLLAALAVARVFEIAPERLREPVRSFTVGKMRGERIEHNGIVIWNDCYNSNPEAAQSMIDVLRETPAARRIAVLGEMLELGRASETLHRQVGRYAAEHGVDFLIGVRGDARAMVDAASGIGNAVFFDDPAEAGKMARRLSRPGDAVLFKGSRGVRVERALETFLGDGE